MRVFRRVVDLTSFAGAARDLRLSNAAVSKHVATLEERLGTKLLHRTTRKLSLTAAGVSYHEHCCRVLDDIDVTEASLGRAASVATGTLRVNVPLSFGLLHISPLLPEIVAAHPELSLDVSFSDRFVDLLEEGVDLVIRIARKLPDSSSLVARPLARAAQVLCASPAYLERHGAPRTPGDIAEHSCVVYGMSSTPSEWTLGGSEGAVRVPVRGRLTLGNSIAIRDAVLAGAGLSLLPSFYVVEALRDGALVEVLADHPAPDITVFALHPQSKHHALKVRVFVDHLRARFAAAQWAT